MKRQLIPFLILFVLIFSNCDNNNVKNENILMTKTWKRGMIDKNVNSNPPEGVLYYAVLDCEKDDTFKFSSDGSLTMEKGVTKCNSIEPSKVTVQYSYDKTKNELIIDGVKYILSVESNGQIKYFLPIPNNSGYSYMAYILE